MLAIHIIAGSLGLIAGYIALYSAKGAPLHRKAGMVFVYAMLTMCFGGVVMAARSFFLGQADVLPEAIRHRGLLAIPVVAVFVTMTSWLWRLHARRGVRHVDVVLAEAAS